jgi:glycosyltransferase involved in cell wall biosynthesis
MAEIVRHGENGFLVDSQEEAVAAVDASSSLDRAAVRSSVEERFDTERMVDDYLAVYRRVVELHRDTQVGIEALG